VLYADHALLHVLLKQITRRWAGDIPAPVLRNPVGRFLRGTETCADSGIPLGGAHYLRRRGSQERYGQRCTDAPGAILQAGSGRAYTTPRRAEYRAPRPNTGSTWAVLTRPPA